MCNFPGATSAIRLLCSREAITTFQLRWAGNWGGRNKDLTAELWETVDVGGIPMPVRIEYSKNTQPALSNSDPYDYFSYVAHKTWLGARSLCLKIKLPGGLPASDRPAWLQFGSMDDHKQGLGYRSSGYSMLNPAESDNPAMLAVGAASWALPTAIEPFSSKGPLPEATRMIKPEIVGSDATFSETIKHLKLRQPAKGTSIAAPHVAGLAARVLQEHKKRTGSYPAPTRVAGFLKQHARDRGTPGPDNTWGAGFAYLPTLTPTPTPTPTPRSTPTPLPPLGAPSGLTAANGTGTVTLTWTPGANATVHWVYRIQINQNNQGIGQGAYTRTRFPSSHTFTGLSSGARYAFIVIANRGNDWSGWSGWQIVTMP